LNLNSIDKKPVHTLILIISQTTKQHLSLLAHISYLLSREEFRLSLEKHIPSKNIIQLIEDLEKKRNESMVLCVLKPTGCVDVED